MFSDLIISNCIHTVSGSSVSISRYSRIFESKSFIMIMRMPANYTHAIIAGYGSPAHRDNWCLNLLFDAHTGEVCAPVITVWQPAIMRQIPVYATFYAALSFSGWKSWAGKGSFARRISKRLAA